MTQNWGNKIGNPNLEHQNWETNPNWDTKIETEPTKEGEVQGTREGNTAPALGFASGGLSPTGRQINVA